MTLGCKPCLLFEGTGFESDPVLRRLCSLLVDWFRGPTVNKVRLQGLETVISFTAEGENKVMMRVYRYLFFINYLKDKYYEKAVGTLLSKQK